MLYYFKNYYFDLLRFIATGGEGTLFLWDRASPELGNSNAELGNTPIWPWQVYVAHMPTIYGATFSSDNSLLLCVGEGGVITAWSVDSAVSLSYIHSLFYF